MRHRFRHRSGGQRPLVCAGLEVLNEIVSGPSTDAFALVVGNIGCKPALKRSPGQRQTILVTAEERLGRVAGAAMRRPLDDVGTTIPRGGFLRIWLITAGCEIESVPERHREPNVQREGQLVG